MGYGEPTLLVGRAQVRTARPGELQRAECYSTSTGPRPSVRERRSCILASVPRRRFVVVRPFHDPHELGAQPSVIHLLAVRTRKRRDLAVSRLLVVGAGRTARRDVSYLDPSSGPGDRACRPRTRSSPVPRGPTADGSRSDMTMSGASRSAQLDQCPAGRVPSSAHHRKSRATPMVTIGPPRMRAPTSMRRRLGEGRRAV
jgi:hypothetical protein